MIKTDTQLKKAREQKDWIASHPVELAQQKRQQWLNTHRIK